MIRLLHGTLARLVYAGMLALVAFAVLISVVRLALPLTDHLRGRVVATLSEQLRLPVQVSAMSVRLSGWTPRLRLDHVVLGDPGGGPDVLRLSALELDLDLPETIRSRAPQLGALTLVGARLTLRRLKDGRIQLDGLSALASDDPAALERFLRKGRLTVVGSEIRLVDDGMSDALPSLTDVRLRLFNEGWVHRLDFSARPVTRVPASQTDCPADARLRVLAHLRGDGLDVRTWAGDVYLNLGGADLSALVPPTLLRGAQASSRSALVESWVSISAGALTQSLSRIGLRGLNLRLPDHGEWGPAAAFPEVWEPGVERLNSLVRVTRSGDGWQFGLRGLALSLPGADLPDLDLDLSLSDAGRVERLRLAAAPFDVDLVGRLAQFAPRPLPAEVGEFLARNPRGRLDRLALALEHPFGDALTWRVSAVGSNLGIDQLDKTPGFAGLSGRLRANQNEGQLALGAEGLRLDLAPIFDHPLVLDRFAGLIGWDWGPTGGLRLSARNLVLENIDVAGRLRFELELPAPGSDPDPGPWLDLRASFHDGNGANVRPYLPVGVVHPDLVTWLSRALLDGRFTQADAVLRGPLKHYPFRGHEGRFELVAEFEDVVLDYEVGWPRLEGVDGSLRFLNQGMAIDVTSGRILDSEIESGSAGIPDLWGAPRMILQAQGEGALSDGLKVLGETPLAQHLGPLAQALTVQGRTHLNLDLSIPLRKGEPLGADGRITWPGPAEIGLTGTPLVLTDLGGALEFTVDSLTADHIGARLWGQPVVLSIITKNAGDPVNSVTEINAGGQVRASDLAHHFPAPAWGLADGASDLDLRVELRNADLKEPNPPLGFRVVSDLLGLKLDLPPPFAKTAAQPRRLELAGSIVPGRALTVGGRVGDLGIDLVLDMPDGGLRLDRGRVRLGADAAPAAQSAGLLVDGSLASVDLSVWSHWWDRVQSRFDLDPASAAPSREQSTRAWEGAVDLRIGTLSLGTLGLNDTRVQVSPRGDAWDLLLDSAQLAGRVSLPASASEGPLDIALERLDVSALMSDQGAKAQTPDPASGPTKPLPSVDVRVADLRWGDASLGRFGLEMRPQASGGRVSAIEFDGVGDTRVTGEAHWSEGAGGLRTRLALDFKSADTGPLLRALDYAAALSEASFEAGLRLEWPGGLKEFSLAQSEGHIELDLGPGRILAVEPGVGRVVGFLNLGALGRRLSLDFTDLYDDGFAFERIEGDISVGGGRAELRRFDIEGPAGLVRVSGFTDLLAGTFDQTVTVEPRIGSSVVLATAVAGGPMVGAAVFLVDKAAGGAIDRLGSYQYRVTGPWANPELVRLGWEPFADDERSATPARTPGGEDGDSMAGKGQSGASEAPAGVATGRNGTATAPRGDNLFLD